MSLQKILTPHILKAIQTQFDITIERVEFQSTRKDFEGDITMVIFPLLKLIKGNPVEIGTKIGNYLVENVAEVTKFNVVAGFLNIVISDDYYVNFFNEIKTNEQFGFVNPSQNEKAIMVEYSSPNTNKPLHLGHVRNNLLGYSVAEIIKASGKKVYKTQIINDRGIHICKSMLAWQKWGNGETPESTGMKGDHLVGKYYVEFDKIYKSEVEVLIKSGITEEEAKKNAPIIIGAQEMLQKWEANDKDTVALWKKMNDWVYEGFDVTYKLMGVDFDKKYYESETYLLGKEIVKEGLEKNVFYKKEDGSVWVDLTDEGLDQKLLLRGDGTSVYITQDLGTAKMRHDETNFSKLIFVVGNEQDYHFKVLRAVMKKLDFPWWDELHHLSYAMVDLPGGKMKSREGTVVDADDLMLEMISEAKKITRELGKIEDFESAEAEELYKTIGLGALKYFILKVDPGKRMLFNPAESIDFNGHTGPFIQYTYARIRSLIRKGEQTLDFKIYINYDPVQYIYTETYERDLIKTMLRYTETLTEAAERYSPALIANYVYELAKTFNSFYHEHAIVDAQQREASLFRLLLAHHTASIIKKSMALLGINVPERM